MYKCSKCALTIAAEHERVCKERDELAEGYIDLLDEGLSLIHI
jgi:hypothetical protein